MLMSIFHQLSYHNNLSHQFISPIYLTKQKLPMSGESMEEVNTELDKLDSVLEVFIIFIFTIIIIIIITLSIVLRINWDV